MYNAEKWHYTSLHILGGTIKALAGLKQGIEALDLSEFKRAWELAVKWVHRNLRNIKEGTITRAALDIKGLAEAKAKKQWEDQGENSTMEATLEGKRIAKEAMRERFRVKLRQELRLELRKELQADLQTEQGSDVEPKLQRQGGARGEKNQPARRSPPSLGQVQEVWPAPESSKSHLP